MFADKPQLSYIKSLVIISMTFQINSENHKTTQEKTYPKNPQPEIGV